MTQEEILGMKPGEELNAKVAEKVIGQTVIKDETIGYMIRFVDDRGSVWGAVKPYSEDMSAAEAVIEKMLALGFEDAVHWADFGDGKYSEPEAICKAALIAVMGSVN